MRRIAAALLLALLLPARAFAFTIIVAEPDTPLVPNSVLELAQSLGYFAREGVDVQFDRVNGTPMAVAALASGQGDMANISLESLLKLTARGETRFRAVSSPAKSMSYVIAAREEIGSVAQLREKTFGIGQSGTLDDTLTRAVLRTQDIGASDLNLVSVGQPQLRLKALKAGKIDATTISYGSWIALPDKTGLHLLVSKEAFARAAPTIAKVNVVSADTLRAKREEVVKVTAALLKLARNFAQAPQSWAAAVAKARPEVPPAELRELAQAYASDWCIDGCFERSELEAAARVLYASPAFAGLQPPRFESWADMSILAEAQNRTARRPAGHEAER